MKSLEIDRSKRIAEQPKTGHNRWHPDVPPILEVSEGEEVLLETRDGVDGQLGPSVTADGMAAMDTGAVHPLTGPVLVKGARPGDLLEVEFVDILPQPHAFTGIVPGLGFLRDLYTVPYLVHWRIADGWATSPQLPGSACAAGWSSVGTAPAPGSTMPKPSASLPMGGGASRAASACRASAFMGSTERSSPNQRRASAGSPVAAAISPRVRSAIRFCGSTERT